MSQLTYAESDLVATRIDMHPAATSSVTALANFEMPSNYPMTLSKNATVAQSTLNYLCVRARLANLRAFHSLNTQACDARVLLASTEEPVVCSTNEWRNTFRGVFEARYQALTVVNNGLRVELAALWSSNRTSYPNDFWMRGFPSAM